MNKILQKGQINYDEILEIGEQLSPPTALKRDDQEKVNSIKLQAKLDECVAEQLQLEEDSKYWRQKYFDLKEKTSSNSLTEETAMKLTTSIEKLTSQLENGKA